MHSLQISPHLLVRCDPRRTRVLLKEHRSPRPLGCSSAAREEDFQVAVMNYTSKTVNAHTERTPSFLLLESGMRVFLGNPRNGAYHALKLVMLRPNPGRCFYPLACQCFPLHLHLTAMLRNCEFANRSQHFAVICLLSWLRRVDALPRLWC